MASTSKKKSKAPVDIPYAGNQTYTQTIPAQSINMQDQATKLTGAALIANSEMLTMTKVTTGSNTWYLDGAFTRNPVYSETTTSQAIITSNIQLSWNLYQGPGVPGSTSGAWLNFYVGDEIIYFLDLNVTNWTSYANEGQFNLSLPQPVLIPKGTRLKIELTADSYTGNFEVPCIARMNVVGVSLPNQ